MKKQQGLPTVARLVAELDGSYMGITLYGIVKEMGWTQYGQRLVSADGDRITFECPLHNSLRGKFSAFYYDRYPKKCIPTRSELEVEMYTESSTSLLVTSIFDRNRDGVEVSLYHREGRSSLPIFGPKILFGEYARELKRYQEQPTGSPPSPMNEESDMILLVHLALANAVSWRTDTMGAVPHIDYLLQKLEKMIRSTFDYDQKVHIPQSAA